MNPTTKSLSFIALFLMLLFNQGCKKDDFSARGSNALRDGQSWSAEANAGINSDETIDLAIAGPEDSFLNDLQISFTD